MTQIERAAQMAASWWAARLESGDKEKFKARLAELIAAGLSAPECLAGGDLIIKTDYDPDDILLDALAVAGVECAGSMFSCDGILPMKTLLRVSQHRMKPKEGYGNWTAEIEIPEVVIA